MILIKPTTMFRAFLKKMTTLFKSKLTKFKMFIYLLYFLVVQVSNNGNKSIESFGAITVLFIIVIVIIETTRYAIDLLVRKRLYRKAAYVFWGTYLIFGGSLYYLLHMSNNFLADAVWDRSVEASMILFFKNFTAFYWTFFKYGLILFLVEQTLLLFKVVRTKKQAKETELKRELEMKQQFDKGDIEAKSNIVLVPQLTHIPIKVGHRLYYLDTENTTYIGINEGVTTVHHADGFKFDMKIPLSELQKCLPKELFGRIHQSRIVALPRVWLEYDKHLHVRGENKALKLGDQVKYNDYQKWKKSLINRQG